MTADVPRIVIAMGDPAGISPELLAKLLSQMDLLDQAAITVIGDRRVLALGEKAAGITLDIKPMEFISMRPIGSTPEASKPEGTTISSGLKRISAGITTRSNAAA